MKYLISMLLLCSTMVSCKKDNNTANNSTSNETIYKGILVGSGDASSGHATGAIGIKLPATGNTAKLYAYFLDGTIGNMDSTNVAITTVGSEKKFTTTFTTYPNVTVQFSTGADGNTPTLSGSTIDNATPNTMRGLIMQETSTQPIGIFITVGHPNVSDVGKPDVFYSFIQYGNIIKGYERWDINNSSMSSVSTTVSSSVTTGQFTGNTNLSATGSSLKFNGIYNNSDSTVTGTYYDKSSGTEIGNWHGWRMN